MKTTLSLSGAKGGSRNLLNPFSTDLNDEVAYYHDYCFLLLLSCSAHPDDTTRYARHTYDEGSYRKKYLPGQEIQLFKGTPVWQLAIAVYELEAECRRVLRSAGTCIDKVSLIPVLIDCIEYSGMPYDKKLLPKTSYVIFPANYKRN